MQNILITGGAGFVGSSLSIMIAEKYPQYKVYALDNLKRRGSELNIKRLKSNGIEFIHGDIRNPEDFENLPCIDTVVEASAEPSVLAGINSPPNYTVNTNLLGTINCLNFALKNKSNFLFLSTSRVYPINQIERIQFIEEETRFSISNHQNLPGITPVGIAETFPLDGFRSIYGATKLSSELMINEYNYFYGLKTIINRCGVLSGPWQMGKVDQGVLVLWLSRHFWGQPLSYFGYGGEGKQVRDILHIEDLFRLVDQQIHSFEELSGQVFNVGGGTNVSTSLSELTHLCEQITGNRIKIQKIAENRQADIRLYITNNEKVKSMTGWEPKKTMKDILEDTFKWLKENQSELKSILS